MARPKKKTSKVSNGEAETTSTVSKDRSLFDHIKQIRNVKSPNYIESLSDKEKKNFNHYMICRFLSMDMRCIEEAAYLTKIFDKMDSKCFYKVCCQLISPVNYVPFIKSKNKKFNSELIECISMKFSVGKHEAIEYCKVLNITPAGTDILREICRGFGKTDKEIDKFFQDEE